MPIESWVRVKVPLIPEVALVELPPFYVKSLKRDEKRGKLNLLIWCAAKDGEPSVLPHRRAQDKIRMHLRMAVAPTCNTNKGMRLEVSQGEGREGDGR